MKRLNKLISSVVLVAFIWNTAVQDYTLALAPESGFTQPGFKERVYAVGQKEIATHGFGPGSSIANKIDAILSKGFNGDVPAIAEMKFVTSNYVDGMPDGWDSNPILNGQAFNNDTPRLIDAFKYFRDNEARLKEEQLEIVEGDFELKKYSRGQLPICRIEQDKETMRYRLVIHKNFVRIWDDIIRNDVWFEYKFPDGKVRTVSLAWAIFYRVAKHEMSDIVSRDGKDKFTAKSHGHMEYIIPFAERGDTLKVNEDETVANAIRGRYAIVNDGLWMWFLGSYCFGPATQYSDVMFKDRALWFLGLYQGPHAEEWNRWSVEHNLPDEFPNLHNAAARGEALGIARAVNRQFYTNYRMYKGEVSPERDADMAADFAKRQPNILKVLPATGEGSKAAAAGQNMLSVNTVAVSDKERDVLLSTKDDAKRISLIKDIFARAFGRRHENVTKAHGRDNAQGEHVDYNQKQFERQMTHLFSMGGAIQNNFLSAAARRDDGMVRIAHADAGQVVEFKLEDLKALQAIAIQERKDKVPAKLRVIPDWVNHTMGVLMQAYERKALKGGIDIALTSNVPYGAGLSNSAANCVAVTMALDDIFGWEMSKNDIVAFARDGEHDGFVGSSCGWLDQLLIVFSKAGFFAMIDYATKAITYFKSQLPEKFQRVLVNTNVPHDLAQTEYTDRNYGELPKAHETLAALLPEREIHGSTSLTLGEINRLINIFSGKDLSIDFADRTKLSKGFITEEELEAIDKDALPSRAILLKRFAGLGYEKPSYEKDNERVLPFRHAKITNEESFALCLRRMRHQLTSGIRTPLTGKAAEQGDKKSFMELINAEGYSLDMDGDFQITGDNGAQDELLDIGRRVGEELGIDVCGRMEGGGGGGNVGFYVDRTDEAKYQKWCEAVTVRYDDWAATNLSSKGKEAVKASIIEPVLSEGASVVERAVNPVLRPLEVGGDTEAQIMDGMEKAMDDGLAGRPSSLKMIPAYVGVATGEEEGDYFAIDVGGTNLRILGVRLEKGKKPVLIGSPEKAQIPVNIINGGSAEELFGFIVDTIKEYSRKNGIGSDTVMKFGLTWSFPVEQTGVASGIHKEWTKGWNVSGVVGQDPVALLNSALAKKRLENIKVLAMCNDTVGTLMFGDIGLILGTGTNAAFPIAVKDIGKFKGKTGLDVMAINSEWGNFDGVPTKEWDDLLDRMSNNPGRQKLEKMISGMYLGEVARHIINGFVSEGKLFGGRHYPVFDNMPKKPGEDGFTPELMSGMEKADPSKDADLSAVENILAGIGVTGTTLSDRRLVRDICNAVSRRAAKVSASALAAVINRSGVLERKDTCRVAIDGSIFKYYHRFKETMEETIVDIFGDETASKIQLVMAEDGSGIGAAMIAAVVDRSERTLAPGKRAAAEKSDAATVTVIGSIVADVIINCGEGSPYDVPKDSRLVCAGDKKWATPPSDVTSAYMGYAEGVERGLPSATREKYPIVHRYGGPALATAYVLHQLGVRVKLIGAVGGDQLGRDLIKFMQDEGMDTSGIQVISDAATSTNLVFEGRGGTAYNLATGGANERLKPEHISDEDLRASVVQLSGIALTGNIIDDASGIIDRAHRHGARVGWDTVVDVYEKEKSPEAQRAMSKLDFMTPSMSEAPSISGKASAEDNLGYFTGILKIPAVFLKNGAGGILGATSSGSLFGTESRFRLPAVRDTKVRRETGAGDSTVAGIIKAIAEGKSPAEAAKSGTVCGSLACENWGGAITNIGEDPKGSFDAKMAAFNSELSDLAVDAGENAAAFRKKLDAYQTAKKDQDAKVAAYDVARAACDAIKDKQNVPAEEKKAKREALEKATEKMLAAKNETMFCLEELWMESGVVGISDMRDVRTGQIICDLGTKDIFEYDPTTADFDRINRNQKGFVIICPLSLSSEHRRMRDELVEKLQAKDRDVAGRYEALKRLKGMVEQGILPKPFEVADVFQHCHSTHSHSPSKTFSDVNMPSLGSTPSFIAWRGYVLGLQVTGIVDHDTITGFGEFLEAAIILGLRNPTCGYEQRLMPKGTPFEEMSTNSPGNKGETYVGFHAVTRARHEIQEKRVIPAKVARFRKTAAFINTMIDLGLDYDKHIAPLTEAGNPTEKHVAEAIAFLIYKKYEAEVKTGNFDNVIKAANGLISGVSRKAGIKDVDAGKLQITKPDDINSAKDFAGFIVLMRNRVVIITKQMEEYAPDSDEVIHDKEMYDDAHKNGELVYYLYLGDLKKCQAEDRRVLSRDEKEALIVKWSARYPEFVKKDFVKRWLDYDKASMLHLWFAYQKSIGVDGIGLMPNRDMPDEIEGVIEAAKWADLTVANLADLTAAKSTPLRIANGMDVNLPRMPYEYFNYSNRPDFVKESLYIVKHERDAHIEKATGDAKLLIEKAQREGMGDIRVSARSGNIIVFTDSKSYWSADRKFIIIDLSSLSKETDINRRLHLATYRADPKMKCIVQSRPATINGLIREGKTLPALTPDFAALLQQKEALILTGEQGEAMAELLGRELRATPKQPMKKGDTTVQLIGHTAILSKEYGVFTAGTNPLEAYYRNRIVEDTAKTYRAAETFSRNVSYLDENECVKLLMSKFEIRRAKELAGTPLEDHEKEEKLETVEVRYDSAQLQSMRAELIRVSRIIAEKKLVVGPGGNISACIQGYIDGKPVKIMLIKASGRSFESMKPEDYIGVTIEDGKMRRVAGLAPEGVEPSTEVWSHRAVYLARPDVNAVVHAHSPIVTGLATAGRKLILRGREVPYVKYIFPGAGAMPEAVAQAVKDSDTLVITNHGPITVGTDLNSALSLTTDMEDAAIGMQSSTLLQPVRHIAETQRLVDETKSIPEVIDEYALKVAKDIGPGSLDPANMVNEIASFYPVFNLLAGLREDGSLPAKGAEEAEMKRIEIYLPNKMNGALTDSVRKEIDLINDRIRKRIEDRRGHVDGSYKAIDILPYDSRNLASCLGRKDDRVVRVFVNDVENMTAEFRSILDTKPDLLRGKRVFSASILKGKSDIENTVYQAWLLKVAILSGFVNEQNINTGIGSALQAEVEGRLRGNVKVFVSNMANTRDDESVEAARERVKYFMTAIVAVSGFIAEQLRILKAFWIAA